MFGATVLMPLLMGLDPNLAILVSGIGTLLFFLIGAKVTGHPTAGNQKEQQGANPRHQNRQVRVQAHQHNGTDAVADGPGP
jgi:hypothetical protein